MRVSPKLLIFEILAFLVFAILAGAGFLAWRLSQGPIDLELIRPQVERSLAEARGGQPVKIQTLALEWIGERGRVEAVAGGFTAMDGANHVAFSADRASIELDAGALFTGKFTTRQLRLENGAASVVRSKEGVWTLADMVLAREPDASDKPFDPVRDINWATLATPIRALISAGSFERVELVNFKLDVQDRKTNTVWGANPVAAVWSAGAKGVALDLDVKLVGKTDPNHILISLASDGKVTKATGKLTLDGVDPMSIAEMFGYTGDAFASGTPANAAFTVAATEAGGLQSTKLSLSNVTGRAKIGGQDVAVSNLAFDAVYDPASKNITLEALKIASDKLTGEFTGSLDATAIMAGDTVTRTPFRLAGKDFSLALTPTFEAAWPFASAELEASISPDMQRLTIASFKGVTGGLDASGSGEVWFDGPPEARQIGVKVNAVGTGNITAQQVVAFWPVNLGAGARGWVRDHIPSAKTTKAVFTMNWPPGANSKGFLPDEHLALEFTVEDATVKFLSDYPPITGAKGIGHLKGNSLVIDVAGGAMGAWQVDEGKVILPQFAPKGASMDISVTGSGGLGELMRVLDATNLKVGSRYGLLVDQMAGDGSLDVRLLVPMYDIIPEKDILYTVKGGFHGAAAPDLVAGFGLTDSNANFELTQDGISIAGNGIFGPAPVVFDWKESFGEGGGAELVATARATPDLLNAFGLAARNFMQGEAAVELHASGPGGRELNSITANLDLTHSQLDLAELGWSKKYDAPAKGSFRYGKDDGGAAVVTGDIRADGLELIGEARLDTAGVLQSGDIERIFSRDSVDLRGTVKRKPDGGYRLALNGPFFDASPWMDTVLDMSGAPAPDNAVGVGGPGDSGPVFDVQLNAERLRLRANAELTGSKVTLSLDGEGPRSGTVTGLVSKDKYVNVAISSANEVRKVSIKSDDAGFVARVLLKADYLIGGKLAFDGTFNGSDGDALITMSDVRLKDAPLVAQLFSLASLQGLADVLSGDGVMFTDVVSPIKIQDGRIDLPGLRASGPAMGITARGWIAPEDSELALDGVLVPSFGVNSLLGGLPIIGDLFVSRQGEGMFAPTYSVRGTFSRARVSINPVSAFTPGVLRRIFENPSEPPPASEAAPAPPAPVARN